MFTISQYFGSDQHMRQPPTVYNTRTGEFVVRKHVSVVGMCSINREYFMLDLPPSYDQVVIGINVAPAPAPTFVPTLAPERTRAQ